MIFSTNYSVVEIKDGLPKEGEEVLFDGGENPPIYGRIKYNGKHPSIIVLDSGGEEEYEPVEKYEAWYEAIPDSILLTREEIVKMLGDAFDAGENNEYRRLAGFETDQTDKQQYINSLIK